MVTALLAAALIGEPMRRETWIASLVAFAGVLIVLRPNFVLIGPAAVLPLFAAIGMSLLIIGNRAVTPTGTAGACGPESATTAVFNIDCDLGRVISVAASTAWSVVSAAPQMVFPRQRQHAR
jgi:drug/metabolite transporter (DMT)-like permease